jgi:lipopolysaccharide export system protein LptC
MSEAAARPAGSGNRWARPGSFHDWLVGFLKIALPAGVGVLLAYLALAPLSKGREISFLLDKNKVEVAPERMRLQAARYRGQDNLGRPFLISTQSAVQATSNQPVVDITNMSASILLNSGPARIVADAARYDMNSQQVNVNGPVQVTGSDGYRIRARDVTVDMNSQLVNATGPVQATAADGYRLVARNVTVDMNQRSLASRGRVDGSMRLGSFSADRMRADLPSRTVVLDGRARLHIRQSAVR